MTWTIVLAGGSGTRLAEVNLRRFGQARPKQYCDYDGNGTLLDRALLRARAWSRPSETIVVIAEAHGAHADAVLGGHPEVVRVEQPVDRGTAPGILLPLLRVIEADPRASVVLVPSDHHVADEAVFAQAVHAAVEKVEHRGSNIVLIGADAEPEGDGYGWILPNANGGVHSFHEKPHPQVVSELQEQGALINTFVIAARAGALADALADLAPRWWHALSDGHRDAGWVGAVYDSLPPIDFSRDVLQRAPERLCLVSLPAAAGWSDVGTPERLFSAMGRIEE